MICPVSLGARKSLLHTGWPLSPQRNPWFETQDEQVFLAEILISWWNVGQAFNYRKSAEFEPNQESCITQVGVWSWIGRDGQSSGLCHMGRLWSLSTGSTAPPHTANHVSVPQCYTPPPTHSLLAFLFLDVLFQRCTFPWMCFSRAQMGGHLISPSTAQHLILVLWPQVPTTALKE